MCIIPKMGFLLRVLPPRLVATHAATFDSIILRTVALPSPLSDEAKITLNMPIKYGGFGIRSAAATSHVAYWCSIALSAPDIVNVIPSDKRGSLLLPTSPTQADFARALTESHEELKNAGIACGDNGVIPSDTRNFWEAFGNNRAMKGLQKVISSKLDNTICTNFLQSRELRDAQRILSAAAKFGGTWKTVLPSSPDLTLSDEDYRNAAKIGLGLPCQNDLPDKCECGEELIKDPAHFLSCRRLKRPAMSTRHDWIVNLLAKIFRELGAVVHVEPRIFDYETVRSSPTSQLRIPTPRLGSRWSNSPQRLQLKPERQGTMPQMQSLETATYARSQSRPLADLATKQLRLSN